MKKPIQLKLGPRLAHHPQVDLVWTVYDMLAPNQVVALKYYLERLILWN